MKAPDRRAVLPAFCELSGQLLPCLSSSPGDRILDWNADQGFAEIAKQVPSIGTRRGIAGSLSVQTGSIAVHDLYSRVSPQPWNGALSTAIRQSGIPISPGFAPTWTTLSAAVAAISLQEPLSCIVSSLSANLNIRTSTTKLGAGLIRAVQIGRSKFKSNALYSSIEFLVKAKNELI